MATNRMTIGVLLLFVATVASASKTVIVDDTGIETIAETVCKLTRGSHTQIGRVSTISQLVAFFKDLSPSHKLASCGEKYSDALNQLDQVVSQSNDNVCSKHKLNLIERFHHNFISRTWRDKQQQKYGKLVAPKMLILFFIHYVAQVSANCKQSLIDAASGDISETDDPRKLETIDGYLREFSAKLGASPELRSYDDITLLWSLVDKFPMKKDDEQYLSPPGNRNRLFLKAHPGKADEIVSFQRECSNELRPVYGPRVLPVLRLVDLGYYQDKEQFAGELASRPDLRRQIGVAQLCEAFRPVKVLRDETLNPDQMVFITKDEAGPIYDDDEPLDGPPSTQQESMGQNSLVGLDALATVNPEDGHLVAKSLRANIKSRERIFRRLFTLMSRQLRDKTRSLAGKLFLSSKVADEGYVNQDLASVGTDKALELSGDESESDPANKDALVRRKREFWIYVGAALAGFFLLIGHLLFIWPAKLVIRCLDEIYWAKQRRAKNKNPPPVQPRPYRPEFY